MSLVGSIESITVRSGIWAGSGIWTMMPATAGSTLSRSISLQSASGVTSERSRSAPLDAYLLAGSKDLPQIHGRRRICADEDDGQCGHVAQRSLNAAKSAVRPARIWAAMGLPAAGAAPRQSWSPARGRGTGAAGLVAAGVTPR